MTPRRYQDGDRDSLIALWTRVFPDDPPHNEPAMMLATKLAVDDLVIVVESDGDLAGACMAGYDGHRGWLYAVAVDSRHRRGGLGTALVEFAVAELVKLGCPKVNLQIRAGNTAVAEFYESLGFTVEERLSMGKLLVEPSS